MTNEERKRLKLEARAVVSASPLVNFRELDLWGPPPTTANDRARSLRAVRLGKLCRKVLSALPPHPSAEDWEWSVLSMNLDAVCRDGRRR